MSGTRAGLRRAWRWIRIVWIGAGVTATLLLALSFQARGLPDGTLESSARVEVVERDDAILFLPVPNDRARNGPVGPQGGRSDAAAGLVFFPGGIVQPTAYAPLVRRIAEAGHPAVIVKLPFLGRHAPSASARMEAGDRALALVAELERTAEAGGGAGPNRAWVVAGHSLGGAIASELAWRHGDRIAGLVLLGTTHPREVDLSSLEASVMKVLGTRDGVAPVARSEENRELLPPSAEIVLIEGANHAQYGYYGPQLMDGRATISREEQQDLAASAILRVLGAVGSGASGP